MSDRRNLIWLCATPLIAAGLLLLVLLDGSTPSPFVPGYIWGTLFGHATLTAAWTAFGPLQLLWRLPLSLLWLLALTVALVCNLEVHASSAAAPIEFVLVVAACLAGQFAFLQLPFWGLVLAYGMRLRYCEATSQPPDPRETQFGIRQLMIFTTIVALVLGAGRFAVTYLPLFAAQHNATPILIFLAVAAILVTLPLILAALLPRIVAIPGVALVLALVGLFTVWELPLMKKLSSGGISDNLTMMAINGFTSAWILVIVLIVRIGGYRLCKPGPSVVPEK